MLMRTDPFRDLDRLSQQAFGTHGTPARPSIMPMDAWREGDTFTVEFDLPGIDPASIDLDVERNVVTVKAERVARPGQAEMIAAERPRGVFSRQLILGDNLDTELFKTELFKPRGPWRTPEQVEIAVLEWVDWYNHRRLHEHCGDIPPVELEAAHYRQHTDLAEAGSSTN